MGTLLVPISMGKTTKQTVPTTDAQHRSKCRHRFGIIISQVIASTIDGQLRRPRSSRCRRGLSKHPTGHTHSMLFSTVERLRFPMPFHIALAAQPCSPVSASCLGKVLIVVSSSSATMLRRCSLTSWVANPSNRPPDRRLGPLLPLAGCALDVSGRGGTQAERTDTGQISFLPAD
ncbi:hypothetical protein LX36DRAFT_181151 [Colletotrichum falcatum]|nr:hypothetical protein LX36DRAFT_181151 [Colletotrichum falcatum]